MAIARIIAFYLPQFHPIPENDAWWGEGFTEWTNVRRARPLFTGHAQPRVPADLGYYDLRDPDVRQAQASLASAHGIEGFCYWHYWLAGRRLLELPFNEVLSSGKPDFPFCLGWANHSWTGAWNHQPRKVLLEQTYPGEADDREHFEYLLGAFRDGRYIRVDGRPLLYIYKPLHIPQARQRFERWRAWARSAGLPGLYLVGNHMGDFNDPTHLGLDAAALATLGVVYSSNRAFDLCQRAVWSLRRRLGVGGPRTVDYATLISHLLPEPIELPFEAHPCVYPNWDNTPRMGRAGLVLTGSTPALFEEHLRAAVEGVRHRPPERRLVFVKSWNEWAEGNYLEPDQQWGLEYLRALRRVAIPASCP
ncbi:MAG: hypothetical protein RI988_1461 [Pseudomonadota bacterium]